MYENINDDDLLGRASYSSREEKRALSGCIMHEIFLEKEGNNLLSVDRFGFCCSKEQLTKIQDENAKLRSLPNQKKRSFYGWAQITAKIARRNDRAIQSTRLENNPYHADISLPEGINRDNQIEHAQELASNADWISRFNK